MPTLTNPQDKELLWKEISRKKVFEKFSRGIEEVAFQQPDSQTRLYYIKQEPAVVSVLALSMEQQVILARQFRPGPNKIVYTLPGGAVIAPEIPSATAVRELFEETGYTGDPQLVATFYDDGYSTSQRYCFLALNCVMTSQPQPDSTEFISVMKVNLNSFVQELRRGNITDPEAAYAALDYLQNNAATESLSSLIRQIMRA